MVLHPYSSSVVEQGFTNFFFWLAYR
jgi:hypothetical protein